MMQSLNPQYSKEYIKLRNRIKMLGNQLLLTADKNKELMSKNINNLAKELDMLYSDDRYFDDIEKKLEQIENELK